jgi:uncharacterized protein (TIGR02145 family)
MKSNLLNLLVSLMLITFFSFETSAQTTLNLKVFLEGPFNGTGMNTGLNSDGLIPLSQPYNSGSWNYLGSENVPSIPNADIVDWVLIELRETTGDASTASADKQIQRQAAFLHSNGSIVGLDGSSLITYTGTITNNLFVIIWHRNHLAVMSSGALLEAGGEYAWDFTTQLSNAYLNGQKQLVTGIYGMIGGDSDASGIVLGLDLNPGWSVFAGETGYLSGDLNLDGQASNPDKNDIWYFNNGLAAKLPWHCSEHLIDFRDFQSYNTVQIGTQCWMAENLNIGAMIPGTTEMANNSIIEKYCYENNTANCDTYGGLYQWNEIMEYTNTSEAQGICPANWHIPADAEWTTLTDFLGGVTIAGGKMKTIGTIESGTGLWYAPNTGSTNESVFSALPGALRLLDGGFSSLGYSTYFWSATEQGTSNARDRYLNYNSTNVSTYDDGKFFGFSVRCIKDTPPPVWSCGDTMTDVRDNQTYATVPIGDQCWMAEDLNIGTMVEGTTEMTNNSIIEKYCYSNNTANCDVYGGLYQWDEMMQYFITPGVQGLCPANWHLPSDSEWTGLTDFLGGESIAGGSMKTTGTIEAGTGLWFAPNTGATNSSGFTALPGGARYYNSEFSYQGILAHYWSSTDAGGFTAWFREMIYNSATTARYDYSKVYGFSVRCVKD